MLTVLLLDDAGEVLEVLTGTPEAKVTDPPTGLIENGQTVGFTLSTGIPIGKAVATAQIFTELLSGGAGGGRQRDQTAAMMCCAAS